MDEDPSGPTMDDLVEAADQAGYGNVRRRVETWRSQGLLPHPKRIGQEGVRPIWRSPPGTTDRMLAICRLSRHTKAPCELQVRLWLEGFPTPGDEVRASLLQCIDLAEQAIDAQLELETRELVKRGRSTVSREAAIHCLARRIVTLRALKVLPVVRGSVEARTAAVEVLLKMALTGAVPEEASRLTMSIERVAGVLPRAKLDCVKEPLVHGRKTAPPWHDGSPLDLEFLNSIISLPAMRHAVRTASDADLERARTDTVPFMRGLALFARASRWFTGRDNAHGLALLRMPRAPRRRPDAVLLTCMVLAILQTDARANFEQVFEAVTRGQDAVRRIIARVQRMPEDDFRRRTSGGDRRAVATLRRIRADDRAHPAQRGRPK